MSGMAEGGAVKMWKCRTLHSASANVSAKAANLT